MPFRYSISGAAVTTDEYEIWFERGVTDGLPVVPPTRGRVARMLAGAKLSAWELLGEMPTNYGRVTVEKAAIKAVMAGCRPEYLPVLIAATEAACDSAFNLPRAGAGRRPRRGDQPALRQDPTGTRRSHP